jgi:hypothetical protein
VLSPDKGPDGAKLAEMMKYLRKIPMTKPGFIISCLMLFHKNVSVMVV